MVLVPIRDESGALVGWYGANTDIDELKQAQMKLRQDEKDSRELRFWVSSVKMRGLSAGGGESAMSDCCEPGVPVPRHAVCPITGTSGDRVPLQTVKALLRDSSLQRLGLAAYYFCPEPTCAVVYFAEQGELYSKDDVRTTVWQKEPVANRLLCYCFGEDEQAIASEIKATRTSLALDRVCRTPSIGRVCMRHSEPAHIGSLRTRLGDSSNCRRQHTKRVTGGSYTFDRSTMT